MSDGKNAARVIGGHQADDETLLAELRSLATQLDPVPPTSVAAARSAIAGWTIEAEMAELSREATGGRPPGGVRSGAPFTLLTFDAPELTVEVGGHRERRPP